ncbi:MAG: 2-dehydropantoate 2-reductase [Gammaproteobacteria bacterium]
MSQFEFAILGAGAIGTILGAHLAEAGHSVALIARERRASQIERDGLRICGLREISTRAAIVVPPAQLRSAGVLIVAMKALRTADALSALSHSDIGVSFSIQNGVMKDELLATAFGPTRVLGAVADTSGEMLGDGEVLFTRNVNTVVGELGGGPSERATRVAKLIDSSGIRARAADNIQNLEWSKFTAWVGLMCLSVTTRASTWKYLGDPDSALILVRLVREVGLVTAALGIELTDQSTLPVASLCRQSEAQAVEIILEIAEEFRLKTPQHRMSTLQDLDAGRPLELDETLSYALHTANRLRVPVPLLETFTPLGQAIGRIR